jgi:hypothetical protein
MKNNRNLVAAFIILSTLFIMNAKSASASKPINIYGSAGLNELLNVGVRWQDDQRQFGTGGFFIYSKADRIISLSADYIRHIGGSSKLSERKPVYRRANINFVRWGYHEVFGNEGEVGADASLNLNFRLGRDLNLTQWSGIAVDIGPGLAIPLMKFRTPTYDFNPIRPFYIGGSITFFIRIGNRTSN